MLFLQWEARDWGWLTRTPAHPPRAARAGHPRGEESLTRTGLRDPAPEGFEQGQHSRPRRNGTGAGGPRAGVLWIEGCPHGTAECPPAAAASALGARASPVRAVPRFDGRPSPAQPSFLFSWICESRGSRWRGSTSQHSLAHSCPRESHRLGAEPAWWGTVSSAWCCLADGVWGQELDAVTLHCGTTRGWSHCIPTCSSSLAFPAPLCEEEEKEEARSKRDVPSIPTSHFAKCPDDLV